MIKIIIINGIGSSGKSSVARLAKKYISQEIEREDNKFKVYELSTIDKIKKIAKICGWEGGKEAKDRQFLHDLKEITEKYNHLATSDVLTTMVCNILADPDINHIFFVNIREGENIQYFIEALREREVLRDFNIEVRTLKIERTNFVTTESEELIRDINSYKYDDVISNDGTLQDLKASVQWYVNNLLEIKTEKEHFFEDDFFNKLP